MAYSRGSPLISTSADSNNGSDDMTEFVSELYGIQLTRQCSNGRIPLSHSTASFWSRPGEKTRQEQQQSMYENCKRLVAKNNKQQCAYYVVMFLCFMSTLVYIAVVIFLLSARSQADVDSPGPSRTTAHGQRSGGGQNEPHEDHFCVAQADIIAHKDLYTGIEWKKAKDKICFSSLKWLPQVIQKVNSSIQSRAALVESKHQNMSEYLNKLSTSVNRARTTRLPKDGVPTLNPEEVTSNRQPVYAHLYLNTSANHSDALIWTDAFIDQSNSSGVQVNSVTGELIIGESGFYFVYSHVTFDKETANHLFFRHQVVKNYRSNAKEVLLETDQGPASSLQGVFRFMVNDTLAVVASPDQSNNTYFGTYLMRT